MFPNEANEGFFPLLAKNSKVNDDGGESDGGSRKHGRNLRFSKLACQHHFSSDEMNTLLSLPYFTHSHGKIFAAVKYTQS